VPPPAVSWEARLLLLWGSGAGACLAAIGLALVRLRGLRRGCRILQDGPLFDLAERLAQQMNVRRPIRLVVCTQRAIPMTWGVFRPTLLLPEEAASWSEDRLRMVVLHELGHIARWDCLTHLFGQLARCLFWFHPLAWLALAKQRQEQEKACDDLVIAQGAVAQEYAEHLLTVTAHLPQGYFAPSLALGMARSARLRDRLVALLDAKRNRRPVGRRQALTAFGMAVALLVPAASLTWWSAPVQAAGDVALEPQLPEVDVAAQDDPPAPMSPDVLKKLEDIRKKLREHYVGPLDDKQLTTAAIKGLLQGLKDPYTDYLSADDLGAFTTQAQGQFVGIGAQLKLVEGRVTVVTPLDNSPALKAGIRPDDIIEAIDGQPTRGLELGDAVKRILGKAGTVVKLKVVHHDGVVEEVSVTRGPIAIASVQGFERKADGAWRFLLDEAQKIGYVRITQFSGSTAKEARAAIDGLQKAGLKGLILDLRSCPGGLLDQCLSVCKMFIAQGQLLTIKGAGKQEHAYQADGKDALGDFPLVVLINEQTASAAEIVAGVLRDHNRGLLVGTRTFGKGSVQQIVKLDDGGALRVTTAFHYLPSGRSTQKKPGEKTWGVDPSDGFYLPLTKAQSDALQKSQMARATLGHAKGDRPEPAERLTPRLLEERYADPQLAAAQRTLVAKLTGGEFIKVGQSAALLQEHMNRLDDMRQKREALLQNLQQLEREIDAVQQSLGASKK
jgi:carboxyl-terminal processing protease